MWTGKCCEGLLFVVHVLLAVTNFEKINHQEENLKIQTMHGQMHYAHWEDLMYTATHDLSITDSDILVGTSYDVLNQIGVQMTLHFCKQDWMKAKLHRMTTRIKLVNGAPKPKMLM